MLTLSNLSIPMTKVFKFGLEKSNCHPNVIITNPHLTYVFLVVVFLLPIYLIMCAHMYAGTRVSQHMGGGQKTTSESWITASTLLNLGLSFLFYYIPQASWPTNC